MIRTIRVLGIPVLSIETDETAAEPELTAGDNGGDLRADRFETGFVRTDYGKPEADPNLSPPDWENL
jgi:hypothetical protein